MNTYSALATPLQKFLASLLIAGSTSGVPSNAFASDADARIVLQPEIRMPGDAEVRRNTRHHVRRWAHADPFCPPVTSTLTAFRRELDGQQTASATTKSERIVPCQN